MAASGSQAPAPVPANFKQDADLIIPNIRPTNPEVSPDPAWRAWRMREQRPELNKPFASLNPPIASQLAQQGQQEIDRYANAAGTRDQTFYPRSMRDLRGYVPERLQFLSMPHLKSKWQKQWNDEYPREPFDGLELDKLPDVWFEEMAHGLLARIWELASATFGQADLSYRVQEKDWTGDMLRHLSSDFIRCASLVARGDPLKSPKLGPKGYNDRGYEHLFLASEDRVFLCTAVISNLLKENCLDSLLFGARPDEEETLVLMDKSTIGVPDGFARKFDRYSIVHKYMTDPTQHLFTARFWDEVDRITTEILSVLLPLINMLGSHAPQASWPPLTQVHQMLHNCVAEAAYLSNGEIFTRSCFWMEFPQPGQVYDRFQEHMADTLWQRSKRAAMAHDANELENSLAMVQWRQARDAAYQQAGYQSMTLEQWSFAHYEPLYPKPTSSVRRSAKVQIATFPFIERSFPLDQDVANGGIGNKGNVISLIQRAEVVYCSSEDSDDWDIYTLEKHLQAWKRTFHPSLLDTFLPSSLPTRLGRLLRTRSLILGALFILLLWHLFLPSGQHTSQYLPWKLDRWATSSSRQSLYASTTATSRPWTSVVEPVSPSLASNSAEHLTLAPSPSGGTGTWRSILKILGLSRDASVHTPRDALVGTDISTRDEDETFPQSVTSKTPDQDRIMQEGTVITSPRILGSTEIIESPGFAGRPSGNVNAQSAGLGDGTQRNVKDFTTVTQVSVQKVIVAEPDKGARKQTDASHKTSVTTESAWEHIIDHDAQQRAKDLATSATIPTKILPKTEAIPPISTTSTRHWYNKIWDDAKGRMGLSTSELVDGVLSSDDRTSTDTKETSSSFTGHSSDSGIRPPNAESKQPAVATISNVVTQRSTASGVTDQYPDGHINTRPEKSRVGTSQTTKLLDTREKLQHVASGVTPRPSQVTGGQDITITNTAADPATTIVLKDITAEEYAEMMDRPVEKDSHWTVSDFFGIPYNCTIIGALGTCFQTVEAPAVTVTVTP